MTDLPWLLPGLGVATVVSIVVAEWVGRKLSAGTPVGGAVVVSFGLIFSVTLTPQSGALAYGSRSDGTCDLTLTGLLSLWNRLGLTDVSLNFLLFIPLGAALGLIPRSRRKMALMVGAVLLPLFIEWTQLVIPVLDRACQVSDVVTNLAGLLSGILIASAAVRVLAVLSRDGDGSSTSPP